VPVRNAFIDKIRANGELAKIYLKWMKTPLPPFPDSVPDISFVAS
jgi:polar amino acid transport system substrate-binding protein